MKYLLIGGQPNTGKTETLIRLFHLLNTKYTTITNVHPHPSCKIPTLTSIDDFSVIMEGVDNNGKNIKILMHSPSDDLPSINLLKENILVHSPTIVITSIRDMNFPRLTVLNIVAHNYSFEFPLARITRRHHSRRAALAWYENTVDNNLKSIISKNPFNLI